jgi:hypothetical protein
VILLKRRPYAKLWIVNTGRFHFVDSLYKIVPSVCVLLALGAPPAVVVWFSAITGFIGMLTHCNVEMRLGPLSWIFNTPELHRWHHSKDLREAHRNYCENVMVWDLLFGTYFRESHRRPPADIGIREFMPPRFVDQIMWPFLTKEGKQRIEAGCGSVAHSAFHWTLGHRRGCFKERRARMRRAIMWRDDVQWNCRLAGIVGWRQKEGSRWFPQQARVNLLGITTGVEI